MGSFSRLFLYELQLVPITSVQAMKAQRRVRRSFLVLILLVLASCSSQVHRFEVSGVDGEFCVPDGYPPQGVWFVPKGAPETPNGFSFMGCNFVSQEKRASCTLPRVLISASVDPLSAIHGQTWGELKKSADYDMRVHEPGVELSIDPGTGFLVLFNRNIGKDWSIWKRGKVYDDVLPLAMKDDDELLVSCSGVENYPGGTGGLGGKGEFACNRYAQGEQFALQYDFISKQRVPTEAQLRTLEAALFTQVEQWHCSTK